MGQAGQRGGRWHWWAYPLLIFVVSRMLVWGVAYLADIALLDEPASWYPTEENRFLQVWARWDSKWYLDIIEHGYSYTVGEKSNVAFFPSYPLLVAGFRALTGTSALAAGVWVAQGCLLAASVYFYALARQLLEVDAAQRALLYCLIFPTAFFFSAVYSESTFLLFSVAAAYHARRRQWLLAGLFGLLTGATRIVGLFIGVVVLAEWLQALGWHWRQPFKVRQEALREHWRGLLGLALLPLGLLAHMLYLYQAFGDPLAFSTVQAAWQRQAVGFITAVAVDLYSLLQEDWLHGAVYWGTLFNLAALAAVALCVPMMWRRFGAGYALYAFLSMVLPATQLTLSAPRFALVVFPFFFLLGAWGRSALLDRLLLVGFALGLGLFTAIHVNGVFVA